MSSFVIPISYVSFSFCSVHHCFMLVFVIKSLWLEGFLLILSCMLSLFLFFVSTRHVSTSDRVVGGGRWRGDIKVLFSILSKVLFRSFMFFLSVFQTVPLWLIIGIIHLCISSQNAYISMELKL